MKAETKIVDRKRVYTIQGGWVELQKFQTRFGGIEWFVVDHEGECWAQADTERGALEQAGINPEQFDYAWRHPIDSEQPRSPWATRDDEA